VIVIELMRLKHPRARPKATLGLMLTRMIIIHITGLDVT
jgi:hypothetical protein